MRAFVVICADADINANLFPAQAVNRDAGILNGLVRNFQQHTLLRVQGLGLFGRNPEKTRVKSCDIGVRDKTAPSGVCFSGSIRVRIKIFVNIPPSGRNLGYRIFTGFQQLPE